MKRRQFLRELKEELRKRRDIEVEEVLFYYDEMIQDAIDSGEKEEIFIANLGSVKDIRRRIEDEEEFIVKVKENNKIVRNTISTTVKIIAYFIFGVIAFSLTVAAVSVFISGVGVIGVSVFRYFQMPPADTYGALALLGTALVGLSLSILGIAVMKWLFIKSKTSILTIFRSINDLLKKKGN